MSVKTKKISSVFMVLSVLVLSFCCIANVNLPIIGLFSLKAEALSVGELEYEIREEKTIITDCDISASGVVKIPDTIDGCPVTAIGSAAFGGCTEITGVIIPATVKSIGNGAFANCRKLTDISLPDGLSIIDANLFEGCSSLKQLTIPEGVERISWCSLIDTEITKLTLPASVEYLEEYSLPRSLVEITVYNPGCKLGGFSSDNIKKITGYDNSTAYSSALFYKSEFVSLGKNEEVGFSIKQLPEITNYLVGSDTLDWHGLLYSVQYEKGCSVTEESANWGVWNSEYSISGFDATKPGKCTITVTHNDFTATFDVNIIDTKEPPLIKPNMEIGLKTEKQKPVYVSFVPKINGNYYFSVSSSSYVDTVLYDSSRNELAKAGMRADAGSSGSFYCSHTGISYELEAGKTYYYSVFTNKEDGMTVISIEAPEHEHVYEGCKCSICGSLAAGVIVGDIDKDEKITAADARLALRCAVNLENYATDSKEFFCCDVDKDNKVTAADARLILRAAVGLEDSKNWQK